MSDIVERLQGMNERIKPQAIVPPSAEMKSLLGDAEREIAALRAALALAIKEADAWLDEARGCTASGLAGGDPLAEARKLL